MGVIVVSLVSASIGLPLLLRGLEMPPEPSNARGESSTDRGCGGCHSGIERIQRDLSKDQKDADIYVVAAALIVDLYRGRIEARSQEGEAALSRRSETIERTMRLAAVKAERATIFRMLRAQEIGSETAKKLVRELDLLEARYET